MRSPRVSRYSIQVRFSDLAILPPVVDSLTSCNAPLAGAAFEPVDIPPCDDSGIVPALIRKCRCWVTGWDDVHRGHVGLGLGDIRAAEGDQDLAKLVVGCDTGIDDAARLPYKCSPISFDRTEPERRIGVKQPVHHLPPPPVDGVCIGSDNIPDGLPVFDPWSHSVFLPNVRDPVRQTATELQE